MVTCFFFRKIKIYFSSWIALFAILLRIEEIAVEIEIKDAIAELPAASFDQSSQEREQKIT